MAKNANKARRPKASFLCKHFENTVLVGCAKAGLECLEAPHKNVVIGGTTIGCGVALDACRKTAEPDATRWDYVFTVRDSDDAVAVEVHHATFEEVDLMLKKKAWATSLLRTCPNLVVQAWVWVASPGGMIDLLPQSPSARRLAEGGIAFPRVTVRLP